MSTAEPGVQIDLAATHRELVEIEREILDAPKKHNGLMKKLGLKPLPSPDGKAE